MKENRAMFLSQAAMIAAIYVVLCVVFNYTSFGPVQARVAECLTILPYFTPAAIPGLFVGCMIANILGGSILLDVLGGSIATLLGAVGTWFLRKKSRYLAPISPILANTLIVPYVLRYGYGEPLPIPLMMLSVGLGEVLVCGLFGSVLLTILEKYRNILFKTS